MKQPLGLTTFPCGRDRDTPRLDVRSALPLAAALSALVLSSAVWASGLPAAADADDVRSAASASEVAERGQRTPVAPPMGIERSELQRVFDLVNGERTRRGLPPLRHHPQLSAVAEQQSGWMAARSFLTHDGPNGESAADLITAVGYALRAWGINVAAGYSTPESLVAGWMASPPHRANILSVNLSEVGVGLAASSTGRRYWTLMFASPAG